MRFYDRLHRLKTFDKGTLSSGAIASPSREQDWTLDKLGNWSFLMEKASSTTTLHDERTHNKANEITEITPTTRANWIDPVHDLAGNMTEAPRPGDETTKHLPVTLIYPTAYRNAPLMTDYFQGSL